jgi:hypothetical protein
MIPSEFQLAGLMIKVILDPDLFKNRKVLGEARYHDQQIILDTSILKGESLEQNFFHELVHWIFYIMNEDDMRNNEKLVDMFAYLLHQAFKSGKLSFVETVVEV